jgi:hypothetical protein
VKKDQKGKTLRNLYSSENYHPAISYIRHIGAYFHVKMY